jgi:hypothetical protein
LLNELTNNKVTIYGYGHTQHTSKRVSKNNIIVLETTFEYDAQGRMSVVTIVSDNRTEITRYDYGTDGIRVSAEHEVWEDGELKSKTKTEYLNDPLNITGYSQFLKQTETDAITNEETVTTYVIGHQRISQAIAYSIIIQAEFIGSALGTVRWSVKITNVAFRQSCFVGSLLFYQTC